MPGKSVDECTKTIGQLVKVFGVLTDDILKDSEKCKQYMNNLSSELQILGYTDPEDANNIRRIIAALSKPGTASALWIEGARESIIDIATLKSSFLSTFCPASAEFDAQAELLHLTWRQEDETLEYYFNRYVNLIYRAYKDRGADAEKKYIIHWLSGLPKPILDRVLSGAQAAELTARQYLESAKRIYALSKATGRRQKSGGEGKINGTVMEDESDGPTPTESGEIVPNFTQADILLSKKVDEMGDQIASLTSLLQQQKEDQARQYNKKPYYGNQERNQHTNGGGGNYGGGGKNGGGFNKNSRGAPHTGKWESKPFACYDCGGPHRKSECPHRMMNSTYPVNPSYYLQQHTAAPPMMMAYQSPPVPPSYPPPAQMYQSTFTPSIPMNHNMNYSTSSPYAVPNPPTPHTQFQQQQQPQHTGGGLPAVWHGGQPTPSQNPYQSGNGNGVQQRPSL